MAGFGGKNAIAVDTNGSVHITYQAWLDMTQNLLRYATNQVPVYDMSGDCNFSTKENGDNTLMIVSFTASSNTNGAGPQIWLSRRPPSYCYGGSSIEYQRSSSSSTGGSGGSGGGGCFVEVVR